MKEMGKLENEIKKSVEGLLPNIKQRTYSSYVLILAIALLLSLVPLLSYIML